ncbi:transposase [Listeria seeligeri]|uniref:transposase n=1 Tax=Listeria seeligeri TaxID=1640 RepID=UPI001888613A|nr:transposase [Listeria seeligeri]MBF2643074.1 transposase [Listeria seeligeri]QPJ28036.1 transposase [Listeria seeligeri]
MKRSTSNLELENDALSEYIRTIFFEYKGRYGARRIQVTQKGNMDSLSVENTSDVYFVNKVFTQKGYVGSTENGTATKK